MFVNEPLKENASLYFNGRIFFLEMIGESHRRISGGVETGSMYVQYVQVISANVPVVDFDQVEMNRVVELKTVIMQQSSSKFQH